ncbi:hypothetical protein JHD50_03970 [Sulfurimonas sp. MAG313]|nr:hypothetical protein [Sulfurimonas sp. MAG313]MDF1880467.1 hypothetical protein [Sulfurimonas sp. MAG313]
MGKNTDTVEIENSCNESRRTLLKKSYKAPLVVALGSMVFTESAVARRSWGHKK